jgi:hypothetical protein
MVEFNSGLGWRTRLIACAVVCAGAAGCGAPAGQPAPAPVEAAAGPHGTRIALGAHEVFFTTGVEAEEARKAGEVLAREKYLADRPASVQLRYAERRYELRLVVRAGAEAEVPTRRWRVLGEAVARECFRGSPVDVHLCDEQFKTLKVVPYEPIRPELPVRVTVRKSAAGGSLVAQYRNDSERHLAVKVALRNPTLGEAKTVVLEIRPRGMTEHGWAEGWRYVSGETVAISHADYEPKELVVP